MYNNEKNKYHFPKMFEWMRVGSTMNILKEKGEANLHSRIDIGLSFLWMISPTFYSLLHLNKVKDQLKGLFKKRPKIALGTSTYITIFYFGFNLYYQSWILFVFLPK